MNELRGTQVIRPPRGVAEVNSTVAVIPPSKPGEKPAVAQVFPAGMIATEHWTVLLPIIPVTGVPLVEVTVPDICHPSAKVFTTLLDTPLANVGAQTTLAVKRLRATVLERASSPLRL